MDELKNLVIQTLETNGILGQLRAQLRSCVFKVIDNQDQVEKGQSGFHWENPQAKKIMQSASGVVCAELIRDFLEFYRLDYTLQIYMPEVNLSNQNAMSKEELARRSGLANQASEGKPLLVQLLESFLTGDRQAAPKASGSPVQNSSSIFDPPAPIAQSQNQPKRRDDFDDDSSQKNKRGSPDLFQNNRSVNNNLASANAGSKKSEHEKRLELASQMLEEASQEERSGYRAEIQKSSASKHSQSQQSHSPSPVVPPSRQQVAVAPKEKSNEFADNYNDDFDEDEDIVEDIQDNNDDADNLLSGSGNNYQANNISNLNNPGGAGQHRSTFISESAGGITVSQSLGVDPSVDSLALEDYDHIEPVERVNY